MPHRPHFGPFLVILLAARSLAAAGIAFEGPFTIRDLPRSPVTVHSGDFNGDGKLDLVSSDASGIVTVLLQDPLDREKWAHVEVAVGSSCYFTRGGDFDGDGRDDLLVADGASTAYFVRSKGDGTFDKPVPITPARGPRWVATGDWNGDGRLDFATSNIATSTFTIFLNEALPGGQPRFRLSQDPAQGRAHALEALDFDGDGRRDLVFGMGSAGIEIYRGNGDGTFAYVPSDVGALACAQYLAVGDFNGDGKDDLAPVCSDDGRAYLGISSGDGNYRQALTTPFAVGVESSAVGDMDRDGLDDLALVSEGSGLLLIYRGATRGPIGPPLELGPTGASPRFLIVEDLDADGYLDVVTADTGGSTLTVFYGMAGERLLHSADSITGFAAARGFDVADLDRDGSPDVLVTSITEPKAFVYWKPGGDSPAAPSYTIDLLERFDTAVAVDLDGDGILDLAGTSSARDSLLIALLDAQGKARDQVSMPAGDGPQGLAAGLIDGGGSIDLAVPARNGSEIQIFLGRGDGKLDAQNPVPTIKGPIDVLLRDMNGDQRTDLIVIQITGAAYHSQNVDGSFGPPIPISSDASLQLTGAAVADLDGDGRDDLLLADSKRPRALVLPGIGGGNFGEPFDIAVGAPATQVAPIDVDGDGRLDVTSSSAVERTVSISFGEQGGFAAPAVYRVGVSPLSYRVTDMNGDSVPDIVAFGTSAVTVRRGFRPGPPGPPVFRRGDANGDGRSDITDAITSLRYLFSGGDAPPCLDAADADDSGKLEITDPVFFLGVLFRGEGAIPAPTPDCGADPTDDGLGCGAACAPVAQ